MLTPNLIEVFRQITVISHGKKPGVKTRFSLKRVYSSFIKGGLPFKSRKTLVTSGYNYHPPYNKIYWQRLLWE